MSEKLFAAYFSEGRHIGKTEVLVELAREVGLDPAETMTCLKSGAFIEAVRRDEDEAHLLGLTGVPAFVCNRQYLISGAQPQEVFSQALERLTGV